MEEAKIDVAPHTYVSGSSIEGFGLFSLEPIEKHQVVIDYRLFSNSLWKRVKFSDLTEYQVRKAWYIAIDDLECMVFTLSTKFSYLNHSRKPNCQWCVNEKVIIALEYIPADHELFIDYREEYRPGRISYPDWI